MRIFQIALSVLMLTLTLSKAHAGLLVEPYLGYGSTPIEYDIKASPGDAKDMGSGAIFGGRVGYAAPLLFFAADYSMGNMAMKNTQSASGTTGADYSASSSTLYGVVGVKIPLVQAYAGYGLLDQFTTKPSSGDSTYSGTAYKLGVGYTGLPMLAINLEYQMHNFNKVKTTSGEQSVSDVYNKFNSNALMLSISAPFRF